MKNDDEIWVRESPKHFTEGDEPELSIQYDEASAVSAVGATQTIYKNGSGSDLSSTMCSGNITADGNILNLKKITFAAGTGGNDYVVVVTASVDGVTQVRKCQCEIQKAKSRQ